MRSYKQMYLVSKNAILYDILLNHTLYHSILTPILISYMFCANYFLKGSNFDQRNSAITENKQNIQNKQPNQKNNSLLYILQNSAIKLIQGRILISCVSVLSQYWISYLSLKRQGTKQIFSLSTGIKRFLLTKQMLLNWSWTAIILNQFYKNYWILQGKNEKQQLI